MFWQAQQSYPAEAGSPRRARQYCADQFTATLGAGPDLARARETAVILVSELVTNAVQAGARCATLLLDFYDDHLRVGVADDAAGQPHLINAGPSDERGRGLAIVASLADRWGVDDVSTGKRVWAEIGLPARVRRTGTSADFYA